MILLQHKLSPSTLHAIQTQMPSKKGDSGTKQNNEEITFIVRWGGRQYRTALP